MRRKGMTLKELLVVLIILGGAVWILFPWGHLRSGRHSQWRRQCQSNLRQMALAVLQYNQDNRERFPSVRTVAGWRGAMAPYVKDAAIFHCPAEGNDATPSHADFWFNARLGEAKVESLENPGHTLMLGDGFSSSDPRVALSQLPQSWRDDEFSPAYRHLDGANYAFADGHVKWLKPAKFQINRRILR